MNRQNSHTAGERKFPTEFPLPRPETDGGVTPWMPRHQENCPSWPPQCSCSAMEVKRSVEESYLDPYFYDQKTVFPSLLKSKYVSAAVTKKQQDHKTLQALPGIAFPEISKGSFFFFFPLFLNVKACVLYYYSAMDRKLNCIIPCPVKNVHHSPLKLLVSFYLAFFFFKSHNLDKAQLW